MLKLNQSSLDVSLDAATDSQFHYAWLRDNCRCPQCLHPETQERVLVTAEIVDDIAPAEAKVVDGELEIRWNHDGHQSRFSLDWLSHHDYSHGAFGADPAAADIKLWGNELQDAIPSFQYQDIRGSDNALLDWCVALRDYGLTIVRGAPCVEGEIERFAEYVGVVREVVYDRLHNVRSVPGKYESYNVASTTLELKPHTDVPNYNNPPGVQMFHFLVNDSEGGESTAVDGFNVAQQIRDRDPEAFEILATTALHFRIFSPRGDVQARNPSFTLDCEGRMKVFRYSNQTVLPANLAPHKMDAFYRAYRLLGRTVEAPHNMVQFKLGGGDMMVTNNLRVMHGRKAFDPSTGERHLQLTYMDFDDVLSRIRMLLKKK